MQIITTRLEGAYSVLEIGKKKEAEGDIRRAHMAYETVIRDFMHLSFVECSDVVQVSSWLENHPFEFAVERFIALTEQVVEMPRERWAIYFQSGNYLPIAFSNFFAALGQHERSRFLGEVAAEPLLFARTFWGEFSKMYRALIAGTTYIPQFEKLGFLESYELAYVNLMSAVMRGLPIETPIAEIDRQFIARNADVRMNAADAYMIEGSPEYPVKFDFRKAGLLATIANTKLRAVT